MRLLFLDLSTKLKTIDDLKGRARGGMVSSLFKVTDHLSQAGHDVFVLSDIENGGENDADTYWIDPGELCNMRNEKWDVLICNRGIGYAYPEISARKRILWTHDLPHSGFIPHPENMAAFSCVVFMSKYAQRLWKTMFPTIGKSALIPNGVDKNLFYPRDKTLNHLIYISAPNRGLKRLPLILDAIQGRLKRDVSLRAYSNMKALHPNEVRDEEGDGFGLIYEECYKSKVELMDPIPQDELAEELGRAGLMILPTDYPEICSNSILQSLASGTPIITTGRIGSSGEWIKHGKNGMLTKFQPIDYMVHTVEMVRLSVAVLNDKNLHLKMCRNSVNTKDLFTWEEIGKKWEKMLKNL